MSPDAVLSALFVLAWLWRISSSFYTSYHISDIITPTCFGTTFKTCIAGLQILCAVLLDLIPLTQFPRLSLIHRILSIPTQAYTLYYANKYIGPTLDSTRVTVLVAVISVLCVLETAYMISIDWSRIE